MEDIKRYISEYMSNCIKLGNSGMDTLMGDFLRIDSEQIRIDSEVRDLNLYAWYKYKEGYASARSFVIELGTTYWILDHLFEAIVTFEALQKKYPVDEGDEPTITKYLKHI